MCDECKKYEEKTEEDKEKFDTSKKGLQFWQKHRDKQIKCNRVNKIECINHVDKRCGTALRDLRNAWRGHKLPDGITTGGKNHLTEVNIKKLQVNYGKAIRSNAAPDVKTAKDHKDAVDKMKKAVMASFYHSIMLKDDKVRHQFCPSGDTSWCKFRRLGNMENAPHHLEPVFLDILEPLYTNSLASFELLPRCLPGVTQIVLESINSILWQKVPKHKFHGTKRVHIGACSTVIYYNQGATGKFSVLTLMSLPLFHNALEVARGKDHQRLKRLKEKSQKVEQRKKRKIEEAVENEKRLRKGGAAYSAGKF